MREKDVSRLLTDEYAERILVATQRIPRSVQEISDKYDIPIAACYRKIHELEEAGFLNVAEIVTTPKGNTNPENGGFQGTSKLLSPLEASQLLTDEYSAKILLATYKRKISAQEISQRYGIPIAACYRKIRILEEVGLIECVERILTQKGKRKNLYTSCLRNAYIFFENGKLRARFQLATGQVKDFGGDWNGLDLMKQ